ncbi:MAG TPA: hypothetical protein VF158_12215 [Longimicrobiales bacterium]
MPQRDMVDFVSAFAIGAVAGAAFVLLLRPEPASARERILEDLKPYRRKVRRHARRARRGFGQGAAAAADVGSALQDAGRELVRDFRAELGAAIADARDEFARSLEAQVAKAQKALKKSARRLGKE